MTSKKPPTSGRNPTIDILRGMAIFTMVAANFSASLLHPDDKTLWFRLYGTFAAPLFILLAGMMVTITQARHTGFNHYFHRGLLIVAFGCLLDVAVWRIYPLLGYDVLYLIGLSIPIVWLLARYCRISIRLALVALLLAASPFMQAWFGYREELPSPELGSLDWVAYVNLLFSADTAQRLLLDGWFPLLPWLAVGIFGSVIGSSYSQGQPLSAKPILMGGLVSLVAGIGVWLWQNPRLAIRDGYSELFYPPTIGYFCTAIGLILLAFYWVDKSKQSAWHQPFLALGHASLFMYILHQVLLVYVLPPFPTLHGLPLPWFLLAYALTIGLMIGMGHGLAIVKRRFKKLPFLVRFLIGS